MENEVFLHVILRYQAINYFLFLVPLELIEHLNLGKEIRGNVTAADAVLNNNLLEAVAGDNPSFTLGDCCNSIMAPSSASNLWTASSPCGTAMFAI
jgi:hypothetical protein